MRSTCITICFAAVIIAVAFATNEEAADAVVAEFTLPNESATAGLAPVTELADSAYDQYRSSSHEGPRHWNLRQEITHQITKTMEKRMKQATKKITRQITKITKIRTKNQIKKITKILTKMAPKWSARQIEKIAKILTKTATKGSAREIKHHKKKIMRILTKTATKGSARQIKKITKIVTKMATATKGSARQIKKIMKILTKMAPKWSAREIDDHIRWILTKTATKGSAHQIHEITMFLIKTATKASKRQIKHQIKKITKIVTKTATATKGSARQIKKITKILKQVMMAPDCLYPVNGICPDEPKFTKVTKREACLRRCMALPSLTPGPNLACARKCGKK